MAGEFSTILFKKILTKNFRLVSIQGGERRKEDDDCERGAAGGEGGIDDVGEDGAEEGVDGLIFFHCVV